MTYVGEEKERVSPLQQSSLLKGKWVVTLNCLKEQKTDGSPKIQRHDI